MRPRAVIVHGLPHARMACTVARELGVGIELTSAPGAAANLGPLWFQQIIAEVEAEFPDLTISSVLDCGDSPGYALAALREGLRRIRYSGPAVSRPRIAAIARRSGARVDTAPAPRAFDPMDFADPEPACREWLGGKGRSKA